MVKQPGLDGRHRDKDVVKSSEDGNNLRFNSAKTYGDYFAQGWRGTKKLENLLKDTGAKSLTDFRKNHDN